MRRQQYFPCICTGSNGSAECRANGVIRRLTYRGTDWRWDTIVGTARGYGCKVNEAVLHLGATHG